MWSVKWEVWSVKCGEGNSVTPCVRSYVSYTKDCTNWKDGMTLIHDFDMNQPKKHVLSWTPFNKRPRRKLVAWIFRVFWEGLDLWNIWDPGDPPKRWWKTPRDRTRQRMNSWVRYEIVFGYFVAQSSPFGLFRLLRSMKFVSSLESHLFGDAPLAHRAKKWLHSRRKIALWKM